MIENEKIRAYIEFNSNSPKRTELLSFLWGMFIVSIPAGYFGIHAEITKIIILPPVIILTVWIVYLFIKNGGNKTQYVLFMGSYIAFFSMSLLLCAYKIASTVIEVSKEYVVILIVAYIANIIIYMLNLKRLIKKGYFITKKNDISQLGVSIVAGVFGLGIGKTMFNNIGQDKVVEILVILLIFMGFFFSYGVSHFLKYYYLKTIEK